jgi:hypothetical protein
VTWMTLDFGLTSNQVWGLTKTDKDCSEKLEAALTATRRSDLQHGTTHAYVRGCVCSEWPGAPAHSGGQDRRQGGYPMIVAGGIDGTPLILGIRRLMARLVLLADRESPSSTVAPSWEERAVATRAGGTS